MKVKETKIWNPRRSDAVISDIIIALLLAGVVLVAYGCR